MPGNEWNDDKLEQLLHSMPKMKDERSADDVLARLKKDERLVPARQPKRKKWMPAFIAVAAMLLLTLLVPSLLKGGLNKSDSSLESMEKTVSQEHDSVDTAQYNEVEEESEMMDEPILRNSVPANESTMFAAKNGLQSHVLLDNETDGMELFSIGLIHVADVVPVTFLIPNEKIRADLSTDNIDSVSLYNHYAKLIDEEGLGFENYHPYKGKISTEGDTVVHQLPHQHDYDMSPTTIGAYTFSAIATFTDFKEMKVVDENNKAVVFDYIGEAMDVTLNRPSAYYKYTVNEEQTYLVPYENRSDNEVQEALVAMKDPENDIVTSVIPSDVAYTVQETKDVVTVSFEELLDLELLPPQEALDMLEGFMLTAASFDKKIQLQNVKQEFFDRYELSKPLPQPIAVNPMDWE